MTDLPSSAPATPLPTCATCGHTSREHQDGIGPCEWEQVYIASRSVDVCACRGFKSIPSAPAGSPRVPLLSNLLDTLESSYCAYVRTARDAERRAYYAARSAAEAHMLSQLSALREENERLKAVMELAADDVTWHTRGSAFIGSDDDKNQPVALAINLNDVFGPCAESEPLALADAPELLAVFRHGGPDAVYDWVANRLGYTHEQAYSWRDVKRRKAEAKAAISSPSLDRERSNGA